RMSDLPAESELLIKHPWIRQALEEGCSVTELEIRYGALSRLRPSFFYLRASGVVGGIQTQRAADSTGQSCLQELKRRLRTSGLPLRDGYRNPRELADWVLRDLGTFIEQAAKAVVRTAPVDPETAAQQAFAAERCRVYVPREAYLTQLDEH